MFKKLRKNKKGFTLIELIVVISIMVILAAVLVPTMMGVVGGAKDDVNKSQATAIESAVKYLYMQEIADSNPVAGDYTGGEADAPVTTQDIVDYFDGEMAANDFAIQYTVDASGKITDVKAVYEKGKSPTIPAVPAA